MASESPGAERSSTWKPRSRRARRSKAGLPRRLWKSRSAAIRSRSSGSRSSAAESSSSALASVRRQAPVAGQVVVEQGVLGIVPARAFQGVDRLGEPVRPLVAPSQREGDADIAGPQAGRRLERLECLADSAPGDRRASPLRKLASNCMIGQSGRLSRISSACGAARASGSLRPRQLLADPVADDPAHR